MGSQSRTSHDLQSLEATQITINNNARKFWHIYVMEPYREMTMDKLCLLSTV